MQSHAAFDLYCSCTPVVEVAYDRDGPENIVETLVGALAEASGVDATAIPPLYDAIDPDAVENLFERDVGTEMMLGFTVDDWNVFVGSDCQIRVCDGTRHTDPEPVFDGSLV